MKPLDAAFDTQKSKYQEICIDFSSAGRIVDFNFAMETRQYQQLLKEGVRLNDVDRRLQIIHWCEQFRKAYNDKNLKFMEDIFSDDALIITGKVVMQRQKSEVGMADAAKVEYVQKNKQQYLASLRRVFDREKHKGYINVEFNDYEIKRNGAPGKTQYYAVTLRQNWYSSTYHDEGMVVLIWDFTNEEQPKIQVRTCSLWEKVYSDFQMSNYHNNNKPIYMKKIFFAAVLLCFSLCSLYAQELTMSDFHVVHQIYQLRCIKLLI